MFAVNKNELQGDYLAHNGQRLTFVSARKPQQRELTVRLNAGHQTCRVDLLLNGLRQASNGNYICHGEVVSGAERIQQAQVPPAARTFQRQALRWPCRFRILSPELPGYRALSVDLSSSGLALEAEAPLGAGEVLPLNLELDLADTNSVACLARVAWCRPEGRVYQAGLEFVNLDPTIEEVLADCGRWLQPGARRPRLGQMAAPPAQKEQLEPKPPAGHLQRYSADDEAVRLTLQWTSGPRYELTFARPRLLRDNRGIEGEAFDDALEFLDSATVRAVRLGRPISLNEPPTLYHYQFLNRLGSVVFEVVCESPSQQRRLDFS